MSYVQVKINLSSDQQKKLINGKSVRVLKSDIGKGNIVYLHPLNAKKVAGSKGGCNLQMSKGEILYTARHHNPAIGAGFFDDVWSGIKSVGKWLKDSGLATPLLDVGKTLITPFVGDTAANVIREGARSLTGASIMRPKTSKSKKSTRISIMPSGGSFLIN